MEHKIGETFEYDGVRLKVEAGNVCFGCYFWDEHKSCFDKEEIVGRCAYGRTDGTGVIFKKVRARNNKMQHDVN